MLVTTLFCPRCEWERYDGSVVCAVVCPRCQDARLRWVRYNPEMECVEARGVIAGIRASPPARLRVWLL